MCLVVFPAFCDLANAQKIKWLWDKVHYGDKDWWMIPIMIMPCTPVVISLGEDR